MFPYFKGSRNLRSDHGDRNENVNKAIGLINKTLSRGGSRIFFRRGCTCLLLYFNTNKPHSYFWKNPFVLENLRSS